ncbi:ATP-binding protein [Sphingomonas sp.]|uniref:sensor histidine kinase n=1 Tax=Sphingomonas sp. TaxID=28214 RepID=UPI00286E91EB|nr:ATP-binding protein [Sphingomonas sp.]
MRIRRRRRPTPPWRGRWSLTPRILAVNVLTLALVALSVFYLDAYRNQLTEERIRQTRGEARLAAIALASTPAANREAVTARIARETKSRIRVYEGSGRLVTDSWRLTGPTFRLRDPSAQKWTKGIARSLDRGFNALVGADPIEDYAEPAEDRLAAWPEAVEARRTGRLATEIRQAPDLTPVLSAAAPLLDGVLLLNANDRNFTRTVREQRRALGLAMIFVTILSLLLSLFLARTIVRPLRRLAIAAHRVRQGRSREVKVPRLPSRGDEIGMLARAVSDMSQSLRQRIDNIEAFAADVTHELKNPLASLRSAVEGLGRVDDPELRAKLLDIAGQDVRRLDRLIGDVSEAARTDAELARAKFEPVDVGPLIEQIVGSWETRRERGDARLAFARPRAASTIVMGDAGRLARAIDNLIDNAISFSPPGGLVEIAAARVGDSIRIRVEDEGPGVPHEAREAIFNRFHSIRPDGEQFGRHSGLGLAIARAIVEGHGGEIDVQDRDDAPSGARFTICLPAPERA